MSLTHLVVDTSTRSVSSSIGCSPVIVGDLLYVGTRPSWAVDSDPRLYAFDLESGAERWYVDVPIIPAVVVPADEQILAASWHGTVVSVGR